jgi:hypothetical protein
MSQLNNLLSISQPCMLTRTLAGCLPELQVFSVPNLWQHVPFISFAIVLIMDTGTSQPQSLLESRKVVFNLLRLPFSHDSLHHEFRLDQRFKQGCIYCEKMRYILPLACLPYCITGIHQMTRPLCHGNSSNLIRVVTRTSYLVLALIITLLVVQSKIHQTICDWSQSLPCSR